jgi:hypothetical protein
MTIKDNLLNYFINRWGMYEYTRGWLKGDCPYCGREDKFGVHIGQNRSHCFVCDGGERPLKVVARIEKVNIKEALKLIGTFEGLKFKESEVVEYEKKPVILPEGFVPLNLGQGQLGKSARAYIVNKRKLDPQVLASKGFGYCESGPLFGYIIMPYYIRGVLVYYQTRNFMGTGPKFNNPKIEDFGIGKSSLIYNQDSLWVYKSTHIVESIFNAETIGDNAIAIAGKSLSNIQWSTIVSSPVERITIALDPDAFYTKALPLAFSLIPHKQVKLLRLPNNQDVNSIGRTSTMQLKRRAAYLSYAELLKIKHNYEREAYYET